MKAKHFLLTGLLFLVLTIAAPFLILYFRTDPKYPDEAGMEACCAPIPLIVLSFLFIAVGVTRIINERLDAKAPSIIQDED